MPDARVIELDGLTEFLVWYRAYSGALVLDPTTGVPGSVFLSDVTGHCGSMLLEPDPVRAAVHKERERILEAFERVLKSWGNPLDDYPTQELLAAIDAPPEPASEYGRGGEAFRERAKECARGWPYTTLRPGLLEKLDAIPGVTEPPA